MKWYWRMLLSLSVLVPVAFAWWCLGCPLLGIDDANITFSYAENIARGNGMTYANNGIPVEGSTSLLWTFICAMSFLSWTNEAGVMVVSLLLLVFSSFVWLSVLDKCGERNALVFFFAVLFLASSFGYVVWMSVTCMDIVMWGAFIAMLTYDIVAIGQWRLKSAALAMALYALTPWVRPESYLVVPMALALIGVKVFLVGCSVKGLVCRAGSFAVSMALLFSWRLYYFGYPFPNTFYAKVSPDFAYDLSEGWKYLCAYLGNGIAWLMTAVIVVGTLWYCAQVCRAVLDKKTCCCRWLCLSPWALGLTLLPIWTGGDHFACFRFFQPVYPLGCLLLAVAIRKLISLIRSRTGDSMLMLLTVSISMLFLLTLGWSNDASWLEASRPDHRMRREFQIAEVGRRNGEVITSVLSEMDRMPRLGVICAGGIARSYKGEIVDLLGLNDVRIAHDGGRRIGVKNHAAFNREKFEEYDVEMFPFTPIHTVCVSGLNWLDSFNQRSRHSISANLLHGLFEDPAFISNWTCVKVSCSRSGESFVALMRNDIRRRVETLGVVTVADYMVWSGTEWRMSD